MGDVTEKNQNELESEAPDAKNIEVPTNTSNETKSIFNTLENVKYPLGIGFLGIVSAGLWYLKKK